MVCLQILIRVPMCINNQYKFKTKTHKHIIRRMMNINHRTFISGDKSELYINFLQSPLTIPIYTIGTSVQGTYVDTAELRNQALCTYSNNSKNNL